MEERALSDHRSASEIAEPRLRRFFSYWLDRKGSRRFPARCDIDPLDFPYLLAHMMLIDVLREPLRFWVRVHGTEMVQRAHYDLTRKLIDDLPITGYRNYVIERCRHLVETGEPTLVHHDRVLDGRHHRYEAIWLPLSDDGKTVTQLICGLIYRPVRSAMALAS
jgi:hypothetical protein